jgi:hypothetical protein
MSTLEIRLQQAGVSDEVIQKTLERLTHIAEGFHSGTVTTVLLSGNGEICRDSY